MLNNNKIFFIEILFFVFLLEFLYFIFILESKYEYRKLYMCF